MNHGYGLTEDSIEECLTKHKNISLIITVDCGITSIGEINILKEKGIKCIVTDHHNPKEELPNAEAVVNPKRKDSKNVFTEYAGVGVAYLFIQAISKRKGIKEEEYNIFLPFVALRNNIRHNAIKRSK